MTTRRRVQPPVTDTDRDRCVDRLQVDFVEGRLERWELEERVGRALEARTHADLEDIVSTSAHGAPDPQPTRTRTALLGGVLAALVLGSLTLAALSPQAPPSTMTGTCVATGLAAPQEGDCPVPSPDHEQLMQDVDAAAAVADQVQALADGDDDVRLDHLATEARAGADRAWDALVQAQLAVATAPDSDTERAVAEAAGLGRKALTDVSRAGIEATSIAEQGR